MAKQRKWHVFILSLLFSFLLWVSINLGGRYQAFIDVDLVATNIPPDKAIIDPLPQTVNIKFNGTGWQLASLYFNPNVKYKLNLASFKNQRSVNLKQNLLENAKVPSRIEAIDIMPESLNISFDNYMQKKVPVIPMIHVYCSKGYSVIGDIRTNPDSVTIGGAAGKIKNIFYWPTIYQRFDDIKNDIIALLPLSDSLKNISRISHKVVGIDINVQMIAEENIRDIDIFIKNKPENVNISIIPPKVDIFIRSGVDFLTYYDSRLIKAEVDYRDLFKDTLGTFVPVFTYPKEIKIIKTFPNRFEYVIRRSH